MLLTCIVWLDSIPGRGSHEECLKPFDSAWACPSPLVLPRKGIKTQMSWATSPVKFSLDRSLHYLEEKKLEKMAWEKWWSHVSMFLLKLEAVFADSESNLGSTTCWSAWTMRCHRESQDVMWWIFKQTRIAIVMWWYHEVCNHCIWLVVATW